MGGGYIFGRIGGVGITYCVVFPSLFALFVSKDVWVMDVWNSSTERGARLGIFVSLDLVMIGRWIT